MPDIITTLLLLVSIITLSGIRHGHTQVKREARWIAGLIIDFRTLLEDLAKHRGMTNVYIKGDHSFEKNIQLLQQSINCSIKSVSEFIKNRPATIPVSDLTELAARWDALKHDVLLRNAPDNFSLHTRLISNVIDHMSEYGLHIENMMYKNSNAKIIINTLTHEVPQIVEILGQARGIGIGIIAQGHCTIANRINMKYLYENLKSMLLKLEDLKKVDTAKLSPNLNISQTVQESINNTRTFMEFIQSEFIESGNLSTSLEEYYDHGTNAISESLKFFDTLYPLCIARIS